MQAAYAEVGRDFKDKGVPQRWPLARLSIPLQKSMDHLDRVLAGCCWEVHATRAEPEESLSSIRLVSKRLTMLLAGYLAKEAAAIPREILTHPTKKLYHDNTAHLLCSHYWLQPIYQELLHSSSRYNATGNGEKNRPRISAHPRPPKKLKPAASGTRFTRFTTGLEVCAMRILCRFGSLVIGPLWYCANCSERRTSTELPTPLGWTRMMFLMIFESSGRRHGPIG